jgi:FKBP-type peptidyl-prolyl cis-trans isomerase FklB
MKTTRLVRSTLAIAMTTLLAASAYAATPAISSDMDKVSYSIGYNLGNTLKQQNVTLNAALVQQGLQDGQTGATPAISQADMQAAMQNFQKQMMQKMVAEQQQAAEKNAAASAAFMQKIASQAGVKKLSDGVYYQVNTMGKGPMPGANDTVTINYKGMLPNGQVFDSSYARNQPATLPVGQVIPGFAAALEKMPVGSTWTIYIAPAQAYGKFAPPSIGPNQALTFQVELLSIQKGSQANS